MIRTFILTLTFIAFAFSGQAAPGTYELDKSHTTILFFINHLGFSEYSGRFGDFDGSFTFDKTKPEASKVNVTIRPSGINSPSAKLDAELQEADYFNTAKFPTATFVSDSVEVTGPDTGKIHGTFTLLGVSKPLLLDAKLTKCDYMMMSNLHDCGFHATATFKRSEFGMTKGIPYVGDEVTLLINGEGIDKNNKQVVTPSKKQ